MTSLSVISSAANFSADGKPGSVFCVFFSLGCGMLPSFLFLLLSFPPRPAASLSGVCLGRAGTPGSCILLRTLQPVTPTLPGGEARLTELCRTHATRLPAASVIQPLRGKQPLPAGGKVPATFNPPWPGVKAALAAGEPGRAASWVQGVGRGWHRPVFSLASGTRCSGTDPGTDAGVRCSNRSIAIPAERCQTSLGDDCSGSAATLHGHEQAIPSCLSFPCLQNTSRGLAPHGLFKVLLDAVLAISRTKSALSERSHQGHTARTCRRVHPSPRENQVLDESLIKELIKGEVRLSGQ